MPNACAGSLQNKLDFGVDSLLQRVGGWVAARRARGRQHHILNRIQHQQACHRYVRFRDDALGRRVRCALEGVESHVHPKVPFQHGPVFVTNVCAG